MSKESKIVRQIFERAIFPFDNGCEYPYGFDELDDNEKVLSETFVNAIQSYFDTIEAERKEMVRNRERSKSKKELKADQERAGLMLDILIGLGYKDD